MARVTVDDCMKRIPNRFQMTLAAAHRARQLANGATPLVESDKDESKAEDDTEPPAPKTARKRTAKKE